jgi:putative hemolysin
MGQYFRARNMVNRLLTISIKVNIPATAESQCAQRGFEMKNNKAGRGFWSWLLGSGWDGGGSNG